VGSPAPGPQPAHDFDLGYAEEDCGQVGAAFVQRASTDGSGVVVEGRCPRCFGRTATEYRRGVPGAGAKGLLSRLGFGAGGAGGTSGTGSAGPDGSTGQAASPAPDVLHTEVHYCECGHPHHRLPGDAVFIGCGASWRVAP
jgi:hypothetical protein